GNASIGEVVWWLATSGRRQSCFLVSRTRKRPGDRNDHGRRPQPLPWPAGKRGSGKRTRRVRNRRHLRLTAWPCKVPRRRLLARASRRSTALESNQEDWCPEPGSNRHGVATEGF